MRADLVTDDVPQLLPMLLSVLTTAAPGSSGWRRCSRIVLEGLSPVAAQPLEPAASVVLATRRELQR